MMYYKSTLALAGFARETHGVIILPTEPELNADGTSSVENGETIAPDMSTEVEAAAKPKLRRMMRKKTAPEVEESESVENSETIENGETIAPDMENKSAEDEAAAKPKLRRMMRKKTAPEVEESEKDKSAEDSSEKEKGPPPINVRGHGRHDDSDSGPLVAINWKSEDNQRTIIKSLTTVRSLDDPYILVIDEESTNMNPYELTWVLVKGSATNEAEVPPENFEVYQGAGLDRDIWITPDFSWEQRVNSSEDPIIFANGVKVWKDDTGSNLNIFQNKFKGNTEIFEKCLEEKTQACPFILINNDGKPKLFKDKRQLEIWVTTKDAIGVRLSDAIKDAIEFVKSHQDEFYRDTWGADNPSNWELFSLNCNAVFDGQENAEYTPKRVRSKIAEEIKLLHSQLTQAGVTQTDVQSHLEKLDSISGEKAAEIANYFASFNETQFKIKDVFELVGKLYDPVSRALYELLKLREAAAGESATQ